LNSQSTKPFILEVNGTTPAAPTTAQLEHVSSEVLNVPFFRPSLTAAEANEVLDTLQSGWLTTGPRVKRFEAEFARAVGAKHAVALNSCTAALHLAVEALGLLPGQAVLVPTMTFAATAEIVRYLGATPILVDCDPETFNLDIAQAEYLLERSEEAGKHDVVGIIPVHVGGLMIDTEALSSFAGRHNLWVVEDAAHAFPAAWRRDETADWQRCGENTAAITCFSFYANKTITTGEGGMAVTGSEELAARMRMMSLHGLSHDAWKRYETGGSWDYQIGAPGYKYNLTDIAAAIGIHQLARAEEMRRERERLAFQYSEALAGIEELELPRTTSNRIHSWHLFPIRLRLERLTISRNQFIEELKHAGVGCSVHWRPLHLHPYYRETYGLRPEDLPVASSVWERSISLPLFPGMTADETEHVIRAVSEICDRHAR
jgi:dTDP-4-amino-4,6-dideoxygalactose transaminase